MYLPVMLEMNKLRVTVFGGGSVALRKIRAIQGSRITVVSEKIEDEIGKYAEKVILKRIENEIDVEKYIRESNFIIIATGNRDINLKIKDVCERMGRIYNIVDDMESVAIFPSFIREEHLIISFSTSGKAPALSKFLRQIAQAYMKSIDVVEEIRKRIAHDEIKRSEFFSHLFRDCEFWKYLESGEKEKAISYAVELWRRLYENN